MFSELYASAGTVQKRFTFAIKLSAPSFEQESITLQGNLVYMLFSTADLKDGIQFYNSFIKSVGSSHPIKDGNSMQLERVKSLTTRPVHNSTVVIRFQSPLVVRLHRKEEKDRYFTFEDEEFQSCLHAVVGRQLRLAGLECHDLLLEPVLPKKTVVKAFGNNIRCSLGVYKLTASSQVITYLEQSGMGSRRSEGFGFFETIG
jgi:CRISPR-associated endoribonuclease Cas6